MTVKFRAPLDRARLSPMGGEAFFSASSSQRAARAPAPPAPQEMQE
jgi:hypothetical protein